jgi:hypothetical protein
VDPPHDQRGDRGDENDQPPRRVAVDVDTEQTGRGQVVDGVRRDHEHEGAGDVAVPAHGLDDVDVDGSGQERCDQPGEADEVRERVFAGRGEADRGVEGNPRAVPVHNGSHGLLAHGGVPSGWCGGLVDFQAVQSSWAAWATVSGG